MLSLLLLITAEILFSLKVLNLALSDRLLLLPFFEALPSTSDFLLNFSSVLRFVACLLLLNCAIAALIRLDSGRPEKIKEDGLLLQLNQVCWNTLEQTILFGLLFYLGHRAGLHVTELEGLAYMFKLGRLIFNLLYVVGYWLGGLSHLRGFGMALNINAVLYLTDAVFLRVGLAAGLTRLMPFLQ